MAARAVFAALILVIAFGTRPLSFLGRAWSGPAVHFALALLLIGVAAAIEAVLRRAHPLRAAGALAGALAGGLVGVIAAQVVPGTGLRPFLLIAGVYLGGIAGARAIARRAAAGGREAPARILDSSVAIDGRIAEVCGTGLLSGTLVVPSFVLGELQALADSADPSRRVRGRRGLETLETLKRCPGVTVEFPGDELPEIAEVDRKIVELARRRRLSILTHDANLGRVASIHGVTATGLNALADALRPAVAPGQRVRVQVVREGREPGQGIAHLDDGTMLVIEGAADRVGETLEVAIVRSIRTAGGTMLFGEEAAGPEVG